MSTWDEARRLAEAGIKVFPVAPDDKRPMIDDWPNRATDDLGKIDEWFNRQPEPNIAAPCGDVNGFVVVDVDPPVGKETLIDILDDAGMNELRAAVEHRTQSGGMHFFFDYDEGLRKTKLGNGVDFQGEGSYVVLPPSEVGGGSYEPTQGRLGDKELTPLPEPIRPENVDSAEEIDSETFSERRGKAASLAADYIKDQEGYRHDLYLYLAGGLTNAGWTRGDVLSFIRKTAHEAGDEEPEDRVRGAEDSLERRDDLKPVAGWRSFRQTLGDLVGHSEAHHVTDEIRNILGLWGGDAGDEGAHLLDETVQDLLESGPPVFSWSETDPRDAPEQEWLVEDLLPLRGSHFVLAPPKVGKSQLIAHLEACLLTGEPAFGHYPVKEDARILHIMLEERKHSPRERVENNLRAMGWTDEEILEVSDDFDQRFRTSSIDLERGSDNLQDIVFQVQNHADWLLTLASKGVFDFIVLDPLRAAHRQSEDDSTEMLPVTDLMRRISTYANFTIAHHTQKPNADGEVRIGGAALRGSGDLDAARDDILQITDGQFGENVVIGRFSRTDSDSFISVATGVDDNDTATWEWISETDDPDGRDLLQGDADLMRRIKQAGSKPSLLPKWSDAKEFYGGSKYSNRLNELEAAGKIEIRKAPSTGGRPPKYITLPNQFTDEEWEDADW